MDNRTEQVARRLLAESFDLRGGEEDRNRVEKDFEGCLISLLLLIRKDVASRPGRNPGNNMTKFTVDQAAYDPHIREAHELIEKEDLVPVSA